MAVPCTDVRQPVAVRGPVILVVAGEEGTEVGLLRILEGAGFQPTFAPTGKEGLRRFHELEPACVLVDAKLPDMYGIVACRRIRELDARVALLLLRPAELEEDLIQGLEGSVDDYLFKPVHPEELLSRLHTALWRSRQRSRPGEALSVGPFRVELHPRRCFVAGQEIPLSPKELSLMTLFLQNPGRTLSREELRQELWGERHFGSEKSLDVYIRKLREKIEPDPSRPKYLRTAWGTGYIWKSDSEA